SGHDRSTMHREIFAGRSRRVLSGGIRCRSVPPAKRSFDGSTEHTTGEVMGNSFLRIVLTTFAVALATQAFAPGRASALCGDVTGDGKNTTKDALAVLRSAVGQPVELTCEDSGPSRLRYYN